MSNLDSDPAKILEHVYGAWVDTWLSHVDREEETREGQEEEPAMTLAELGRLMQPRNMSRLLDQKTLQHAVRSFRSLLARSQIVFGGTAPPSCDDTNPCATYSPSSSCKPEICKGAYPIPEGTTLGKISDVTDCEAIRATLLAMGNMLQRPDEWGGGGGATATTTTTTATPVVDKDKEEEGAAHHHLFSGMTLQDAVEELVLMHSDMGVGGQPPTPPNTCCCPGGRSSSLPTTILAPDRRPHPTHDTHPTTHRARYPTADGIKLCADAKYYFVLACGGGGGGSLSAALSRVVMDTGNDILIGDYCEAAGPETLDLLQRVGVAAWAFLRLLSLPEIAQQGQEGLDGDDGEGGGHRHGHVQWVTSWQFDNLAAAALQFRVLAFYRDHAQPYLPTGGGGGGGGVLYGSRMTGWTKHRSVDIAIMHGVAAASFCVSAGGVSSSHGQEDEQQHYQLTRQQYAQLSEVCTLINDIVDFRSDTARRTRENVVLRGTPRDGRSFCEYVDSVVAHLLKLAADVMMQEGAASVVASRVIMGFCNWAVMGSHHKVFEVVTGVRENSKSPPSTCAAHARHHASSTGNEEKEEEEEGRSSPSSSFSSYTRLLDGLKNKSYGTLSGTGWEPSVWKMRVEMDRTYGLVCYGSAAQENHDAWLADMTRSLLAPDVLRRLVDVVHFEWCGDVGDRYYCP